MFLYTEAHSLYIDIGEVSVEKIFNDDDLSHNFVFQVLDSGLAPANKIIYANPCKTRSFIKHAYARGVDMMTFDNIEELVKVKESHPQAR